MGFGPQHLGPLSQSSVVGRGPSSPKVGSNNQLGQLERLVRVDADSSAIISQPYDAAEPLGSPRMDGPAAGASGLLLLVLLAISFERILGLDRVVNQWIKSWQQRRLPGPDDET